MSIIQLHRQSHDWGLKFRPDSVSQLILPERMINMFSNIIKKKELCNMLFVGVPGCGKTSSALVISEELGCDTLYLNLSKDTSIDILREKITSFGMQVSIDGERKMIIADEADGASPSLRKGLKAEIERLGDNVGFIFITNFGNVITSALSSRTQKIDFVFSKEESNEMKTAFSNRIFEILDLQEVTYDKKAVYKVVQDLFPDMRKTLNELQKFALQGNNEIRLDKVINSYNADLPAFFKILKSKKYKDLRAYITNLAINPQYFYSDIFNNIEEFIQRESISHAVLLLSKYSYESPFVIDQELNLTACCFELMLNCKFN